MKWRQFTIRTMLLAVTGVAIFCAGYRIGFGNGHNARFDDLVKLIQDAIAQSSGWVANGTIDQMDRVCSLVVSEGSSVADTSASTSTDAEATDPFSSISP